MEAYTLYSIIADPHYRIILNDAVMDNSVLVATGSAEQMDKAMRDIYESKVTAFEDAYEAHLEEMACDY